MPEVNMASPEAKPKTEPKPKTVMTAKKIKILVAVAYGNLFLGSCYSLMAPIYPAENLGFFMYFFFEEDRIKKVKPYIAYGENNSNSLAHSTSPHFNTAVTLAAKYESDFNFQDTPCSLHQLPTTIYSRVALTLLISSTLLYLAISSHHNKKFIDLQQISYLLIEAERKNASATAYGLVFGVYQLSMFISAPIYGKIIIILKPGFLMKAGMAVSGVCVILFSFLDYAPPGAPFIALSILIRAVDALGASAFLTASYTTLGCELPDVIGRAMSIVETAFSVGLAIGPVLGGVLFELGGFSLPFLVVGALLLTGTVVNIFLFTDTDDVPPQSISVRKLLANVDFLIDILAISTCFAMLGFNEATLEPHLRQFHLTPTVIGGIFLISGVLDAVSAPIWGIVSERVPNAQALTFLGGIAFIVCFLIVGPVSFLHFETTLTWVIVAQVLLGLGMAGQIISSLTHGMKHTVERGFPDEVGTYGLISGLLFSSACLGAFIGPSIGGILIDYAGYRVATTVVVIAETIVTCICGLRLLIWLCQRKRTEPDIDQKSIEKA